MRSRRNSASLFLMLAAPVLGLAQTQPPPAGEKPASVEGEVRNMITGMPVERAHVSLRRFANGEIEKYGALTSADGKFTILGIPAGSYQVAMDRVGYVAGAEVARTQLKLSPAEKKDNYQLKLIPVGTISGRVLDADGAPIEGISVQAELAGRPDRSATTDDRGQYRIGGLRPGKYRVRAMVQLMPIPPEIRTDGTTEVNYGTTYHPGALDLKSATAVTVGPATEVIGIDIRMVRIPILRVAGKVSGLQEGAKQVVVQILNDTAGGTGALARPDGSFEVWRLSPGKYTATAMLNNGGDATRSVPVDFELGESDIDNIELRMLPPEDVKGQLEFDDEMARPKPPQQSSTQRQPRPAGIASRGGTASQSGASLSATASPQSQGMQPMRRITLRSGPNSMGQMKMADVAEDGSFTIEKVMPGKYVVALNGFPAFVKSVRIGQTTEDGPALDLRYGAGGAVLTVTLSSAYATIGGVVRDDKGPAAGARVVLRDTNNRNISSGAISAADGAYTINHLPPGKYKLLVLDEGESNLMTNEANLDDFDDRAETIELRPKETLARDLTLRPVTGK